MSPISEVDANAEAFLESFSDDTTIPRYRSIVASVACLIEDCFENAFGSSTSSHEARNELRFCAV